MSAVLSSPAVSLSFPSSRAHRGRRLHGAGRARCVRAAAALKVEFTPVEVRRCKLDPGLKARLVSKVQPYEEKRAFNVNLVP